MNGNWIAQSFTAMLLLVPVWLAIGYFDRNHQIKPEVFLLWYLVGIIVSTALYNGQSTGRLVGPWKIDLVIVLIGMTAGATANIMIFRAVAAASNPGLPLAVTNTSSVGMFLASVLLARLAPTHFPAVKNDPWSFVGVCLAVLGVSIVAIRR